MLNKSLYENGDGGQLLLRNYEIQQTESLSTLVYLALFGGNVEEETKKENNVGELRQDWWGNDPTDPASKWINSRTEKVLRGLALNNTATFQIERAVKEDIKSLEQFGETEVNVTLPLLNTIAIEVIIREPSAKSSTRLKIIWDATKKEIIENQQI